MRRLGGVVLVCGLAALAGCGDGSPALAPVSGQVLVDGQPYPNAFVLFQPIGTKDNPNPGRGSMGITDADGKFALKYEGGIDGAVVGKHQVRISTNLAAAGGTPPPAASDDAGSPDGAPAPTTKGGEIIPGDWNTDSKQTFDVPAGGATAVKFEITSVRAKKGGKKR